jgi:hypothetical protein
VTWTYEDPATSYRDAVRLLIGDTVTADQLLSDEELAALLTREGGVVATATPASVGVCFRAAAAAAEALAARYSRFTSFSEGGHSESAGERVGAYQKLAESLRKRMAVYGVPWAGGLTVSWMEVDEADTDAVQPGIRIGIHSDPTADDPTYPE